MIPNPKDYKRLFRMTGTMSCTHSEFFVRGSLGLGNPLLVFADGVWHTFIHCKGETRCAREGLMLFSDAQRYAQYAQEFRAYLAHLRNEIIPKYATVPTVLSKQEFVGLMEILPKFWHYYGFTEFPYTDLAYQSLQKTGDSVLSENLADLGALKFTGREVMNALLFTDGVIPNVLRFFSAQYLDGADATYLYQKELLGLFDGYHIPSEAEARKQCYAMANDGGEAKPFTNRDASELARTFTPNDNQEVFHGVVARKGKAIGKAIVMPMLTDMKQINAIAARMQAGDILVAESTTPEIMPLCRKAAAIVTDQGGMLSHAAIVSRELKIPCIVGTNTAVQVLHDGDLIEVDADQGIVRKL